MRKKKVEEYCGTKRCPACGCWWRIIGTKVCSRCGLEIDVVEG